MKHKKIVSIITILTVLLYTVIFCIPIKAEVPVPGYSDLYSIQEAIDNGDDRTGKQLVDVFRTVGQAIGVIMNPIQTTEFIRDIVDPVLTSDTNYPSSGTEQQKINYVTNYINTNTSLNNSGNSYTLNNNAKNLYTSLINKYIDNCGYVYGYSFDIAQNYSLFGGSDIYSAVSQEMEWYPNKICFFKDIHSRPEVVMYSEDVGFVLTNTSSSYYVVQAYNMSNWAYAGYDYKKYNTTYKDFRDNNSTVAGGYTVAGIMGMTPDTRAYSSYDWCVYSQGGYKTFKIFKTLNDLKATSVGASPYYISNTWNNYKSSNSEYTVNSNNCNNVSYGDVNSYVTNYHDDTGDYPSPTEIQVYIELNPQPTPTPTPEPTPTPDNPSGGTTVSSNGVNVYINNNPTASNTNNNTYTDNSTTNNNFFFNLLHGGSVSGNGIGGTVSGNGDDSSGNIFDWLGDLGQVLGNLIKNLGEALLNIIRGITELIESIVVGLPTMFFDFMGAVFGWMPEEWVTLLSLSLACMLIYGIIKIFRG